MTTITQGGATPGSSQISKGSHMKNFGQLATVYCGVIQLDEKTNHQATMEVITVVYGQVQAFISDTASLGETADQVVNTIVYLDETRTDVDICKDCLYAWAWRYTTGNNMMV